MTEQKEREKSEDRGWPRDGVPLNYGTGRGMALAPEEKEGEENKEDQKEAGAEAE